MMLTKRTDRVVTIGAQEKKAPIRVPHFTIVLYFKLNANSVIF
jgi:hypothetical protein